MTSALDYLLDEIANSEPSPIRPERLGIVLTHDVSFALDGAVLDGLSHDSNTSVRLANKRKARTKTCVEEKVSPS